MLRHKNIAVRIFAWLGLVLLLVIPIFARLWQLQTHEREVKNTLGDFAYGKTAVTVTGIIDEEPQTKPTAQDFTIHIQGVSVSSSTGSANDTIAAIPIDTRILVSTK